MLHLAKWRRGEQEDQGGGGPGSGAGMEGELTAITCHHLWVGCLPLPACLWPLLLVPCLHTCTPCCMILPSLPKRHFGALEGEALSLPQCVYIIYQQCHVHCLPATHKSASCIYMQGETAFNRRRQGSGTVGSLGQKVGRRRTGGVLLLLLLHVLYVPMGQTGTLQRDLAGKRKHCTF